MINTLETKISELKNELGRLNNESIPSYSHESSLLQSERDKKIQKVKEILLIKEKELNNEKDRLIKSSEAKLNGNLRQLLGSEGEKALVIDNEFDKKALEFAKERANIESMLDKMVSEKNDEIDKIESAYNQEFNELSQRRQKVFDDYAPDIEDAQKVIDDIYGLFENSIDEAEAKVDSAEQVRNSELNILSNERQNVIASYNSQIQRLKNEYKLTDRDFNKRIAEAQRANKATTRLKSSQQSQLNKISLEITKCSNKLDAELVKIDSNISTTESKLDAGVNDAQKKLDDIISKREAKLEKPYEKMSVLEYQRDAKVKVIDSEISDKTSIKDAAVNKLLDEIDKIEKGRIDQLNRLDEKIKKYAMSGDTCFDEVLNDSYKPFIHMSQYVELWETNLQKLTVSKTKNGFTKVKNRIENNMSDMDYEDLVEIADLTKTANNKVGIAGIPWIVFLAVSTLLSGGLASLLIFAQGWGTSKAIGISGALLFVIFVSYSSVSSSRLSKVIMYLFLAKEYKTLDAIHNHSFSMTEELETAKLRERGDLLYSKFAGPERAKQAHKEYVNRVIKEFEGKLNSIRSESTKEEEKIYKLYEQQDKELKQRIEVLENKHDINLQDIEQKLSTVTVERDDYESIITNLLQQRKVYDDLLKTFPEDYIRLDEYIGQKAGNMKPGDTFGGLPNPLYIFSGASDENNVAPISELKHNMKPTVLLYDTFDKGNVLNQIGRFFKQMVNSIVFSSCPELREQYVIDMVTGAYDYNTQAYKDLRINAVGESDFKGALIEISNERNIVNERLDTLEDSERNLAALNRELAANRKRIFPYRILHIIVPKRDQIDNANKLLINEFKQLLITDRDSDGVLLLFYIDETEWNAAENDEIKKEEDIIYLIKKSGNLNDNVYSIDDELQILNKI